MNHMDTQHQMQRLEDSLEGLKQVYVGGTIDRAIHVIQDFCHLRRINNKHGILCGALVKIKQDGSTELIGEEEPVIVFRARDRLAVPMLRYYLMLCVVDGATEFQIGSMREMIDRFEEFRDMYSVRMKQPGITGGM